MMTTHPSDSHAPSAAPSHHSYDTPGHYMASESYEHFARRQAPNREDRVIASATFWFWIALSLMAVGMLVFETIPLGQ